MPAQSTFERARLVSFLGHMSDSHAQEHETEESLVYRTVQLPSEDTAAAAAPPVDEGDDDDDDDYEEVPI